MMLASNSDSKATLKESIFTKLMDSSSKQRSDNVFATILSSYLTDEGSMPAYLGLDKQEYVNLMQFYFPGYHSDNCGDEIDVTSTEAERFDEQDDLYKLLDGYKLDDRLDSHWMTKIVIAGCMGGNHLWQDLGLWSRAMLTELMEFYYPELARQNDKNMKWKKFLYKQLCNQEGIYTCRSPSCEVCVDYKECFAPE